MIDTTETCCDYPETASDFEDPVIARLDHLDMLLHRIDAHVSALAAEVDEFRPVLARYRGLTSIADHLPGRRRGGTDAVR